MANQSAPELGNFLRLVPLSLDDLPAHPDLPPRSSSTRNPASKKNYGNVVTSKSSNASDPANTTAGGQFSEDAVDRRPPLPDFLKTILMEAVHFIDNTVPKTFSSMSIKSSPPASAEVEVLKRSISPSEVLHALNKPSKVSRDRSTPSASTTGEVWFARRSRHANHSNDDSSANYPEFDHGLRVNHCEKERDYTLDLFDSYRVLDWDEQTKGLQLGNGFEEVDMRSRSSFPWWSRECSVAAHLVLKASPFTVYEMCHKLPFPLYPRVFTVLVITAKTGQHASIDLQIPIDIHALPQAFYSNGRNRVAGDSALKRKKLVLGYIHGSSSP